MHRINKSVIVLLTALVLFVCSAEAFQKKKKHAVTEQKPVTVPKVSANYGKYDFTFATLEGRTVHLTDYAGKVVLVNIWAPWCGPCRGETPGFVKMYEQYKDKGFQIVGVAVQTNENDVRSFIQQQKISWPVGIRDEVADKYSTYGLPDNFLFKPDGSLIKHFIGYTGEETLKPLIEEALKEVVVNDSKKTTSN